MAKTRKTISPEFKAKVALESIRGVVTTNALASKYKIHPNQITKWKKQAQEELSTLFQDGRAKSKKDDTQVQIDQLLQEIGRLQFELSWLKKKLEN